MPTTLPDVAVATAPGLPVAIVLPAVATGGAVLTGFGQPAGGIVAPDAAADGDGVLAYTPWAGFLGVDTFAYAVTLPGGGAAEGRVLVTVAVPNLPPVANDDTASTRPGTAVVVPVLANDTDPDGDPLSIAGVVMSGHGTVAVDPTDQRRLRYVPQAGFVGRDSFAYTASDGRGGLANATVSVAVEAANRPPVARDDAAQAVAGSPVTVPVLANDSDPDGDPLRLAGFDLPASGGTLAANADGSVTYVPPAGFAGPDAFAYTVNDGRGGTARARVAVEVRRPNAPPVAVADQVTTPAGTPVTVRVLANDSDPDGDPLGLVALGLPDHGTLAVNPDRSVTYAPAAGYAGPDAFTYTAGDGWGGTATARVAVTVEPPPARPTFANGYLYRRRLAVPAAAVAEGEHQGFPLWVRLQGDWLRPAAASPAGRLETAAGLDLRFEAEDGTRLPHEVAAYDPAAGLLQAWVRLPRLSAAATARLLLYYGRPGLAASEADPAGLWRDYLAVWHLPAVADAGPSGRALARAGTVTDEAAAAGALAGAMRLAGAGVLRRDDAAFLDNLGALTVQLRAKADAVGHERGPLNLGSFGGDAASALTIRYAGAGGAIHAKLKTTAGAAFLTTAAGAQGTAWRALDLAWASGDARPTLYLDGAAAEAASGSALPAGAAATDVVGPLILGAGAKDTAAGGWQGLLDEVRLRASRLPAAWLAAERANQAQPDAFYGAGPEDAPGDARPGAVAVPLSASTRAGTHVDVDVLAAAVVSAGALAPTLASVGQPLHGTATVIAGKVRYTPTAGYVGADSFAYAIVSGGKASQGRVSVAVAPGVPATGGGTAPRERWPVPTATVRAGGAGQPTLRAALTGTLLPGTVVEVADGTYAGAPIEITADGTAANPIVVTARNVGAARLSCAIVLRGDHVWLRGFTFDDAGAYRDPGFDENEVGGNVVVYGRGCRVLRNAFVRRRVTGDDLDKTCVAIHRDARAPVVAYNHFDHAVNFAGLARPTERNGLKYHFNYLFFQIGNGTANSAGGVVERNHFRRSPGLEAWGGEDVPYEGFKTSTLTVGRLDRQDYQYEADILFAENLFQDMGKEAEFSLRCRGLKVARNTFLGRWSKLRMRFCTDFDVFENWFEDCDGISCRGRRHRVRWNRFLAGAELKLEAGNMDIEAVADSAEATRRPRARDCVLVGNSGAVVVGFKVGTGDVVAMPAKDNAIRGHLSLAGAVQGGFGAVVARTDREDGTTFATAPGEAALAPARLPAAEVGLAYVGADA